MNAFTHEDFSWHFDNELGIHIGVAEISTLQHDPKHCLTTYFTIKGKDKVLDFGYIATRRGPDGDVTRWEFATRRAGDPKVYIHIIND